MCDLTHIIYVLYVLGVFEFLSLCLLSFYLQGGCSLLAFYNQFTDCISAWVSDVNHERLLYFILSVDSI